MQNNPKITPYPINAVGGAMVNIPLTMMCSKALVIEDPNYNGGQQQGLTGFTMDTQPSIGTPPIPAIGAIPPAASPQYQQVWLPNSNGQNGPTFEPIIFGGTDGRVHGGDGNYVGAAGTVILQLTTNTEYAGGVLLYEWD